MATIVFNGQEYESVDAMPAEIRRLYEQVAGMLADADGDGMPDVFQQTAKAQVMTASQYVVDGKVYHRLEDLPPEARQHYEQAMARFDTNRNGIPDMLEGGAVESAQSPMPGVKTVPAPVGSTTIPTVRVVGEGSPESRTRMLMLAVVVLLIVVAGLAYLLLTRYS